MKIQEPYHPGGVHNHVAASDYQFPPSKSKATMLVKIIWCCLAITTISFCCGMAIEPLNINRYTLVLVIIWPLSLIMISVAKKGNARISAILYISILLLTIFAFSWTGGGIRAHAIKLLPTVVLFAGLTLGKKEVWLFGLIAFIGCIALVICHYLQIIHQTNPPAASPLIYLMYITAAIFMLCFLENLSVEALRKALSDCQDELEGRILSEEKLKIKNDKLTKVAFLQSQVVRRPVASVLGLINVMKLDKTDDPQNLELISMLEMAAKELDAVIHQIVKHTSDIDHDLDTKLQLEVDS